MADLADFAVFDLSRFPVHLGLGAKIIRQPRRHLRGQLPLRTPGDRLPAPIEIQRPPHATAVRMGQERGWHDHPDARAAQLLGQRHQIVAVGAPAVQQDHRRAAGFLLRHAGHHLHLQAAPVGGRAGIRAAGGDGQAHGGGGADAQPRRR